jgi:hypothetical protein
MREKTPQKFFLELKFFSNMHFLLHQGIIPGPTESPASFQKRAAKLQQIPENKEFSDSLALVEKTFGMRPSWASCHYTSEGLNLFEAAAAFIDAENNVTIHIRPYFKGKKRFLFYKTDEIIAHEMVHAIRAAFNEPAFEEFLASRVFSSPARRFFGSLIESPQEAWLLLIPVLGFLPLAYFTVRYWKKSRAWRRCRAAYPLCLTDQQLYRSPTAHL